LFARLVHPHDKLPDLRFQLTNGYFVKSPLITNDFLTKSIYLVSNVGKPWLQRTLQAVA
jgi:hypothetical protein